MKRPAFKIFIVAALVICMSFAIPGMDASAISLGGYTVGQDIGRVKVFQSDSLSNCTYSSGSLVSGLSLSYVPYDGIYLSGTPQAAGTYYASYAVTTANGVETLDISFSVADAPVATATPVTTPEPEYVPTGSAPKITKHPTGETIEAGGSAKFIARADNASKIIWRLVSADTTCTYPAADGPDYFRGLQVSGLGTDTLILSNIPESLSGWCVEAKFENDYGASYSNGARVTVLSNEPVPTPTPTPAPTAAPSVDNNGGDEGSFVTGGKQANINSQPKAARVEKGESVTLSVKATSPNNGSLSYQWYSARVNDPAAALPISGASDDVYTFTPTEDTAYYWVAIWNTKEGTRSEPLFSSATEVSLIPEATPTPAPTPTPVIEEESESFLSSTNVQLILFGVVGLLALAALIGVVIYLRIEAKREDE